MRYILFLLLLNFVFLQHYNVQGDVVKTKNGIKGTLIYQSNEEFSIPPDIIQTLDFQFYYETKDRVRLKIKDAKNERWEVPGVVISETPSVSPTSLNYDVLIQDKPFAFKITRKSDNYEIFNTNGYDFYFADQFIELSTSLQDTNPNIYGLGERVHNFRLDPKNKTYIIWNRDHGTPVDLNLYGTHPFYLELLDNGKSHGGFFLNSNAQEFNINGPGKSMTYRTIGGILDLFWFMGDSPTEVVKQYQEVIGKPAMPPFWSLGYHQCRWGYKSIAETEEVVDKFAENGIPLETMWNDIDFMDKYKDWTVDPVNFALSDFQKFIEKLHSNHQQYMQILDPGIHNETGYEPYDYGKKLDIFIKQKDKVHDLVNKVWPGLCVFPDLSFELGQTYFKDELKKWFEKLDMDGLWIDMNEIAGFCDGECLDPPKPKNEKKKTIGNFDPMNPPYLPGGYDLNLHTIRADAETKLGMEYNVHSLYGMQESKVVHEFLQDFRNNKRSFVITRSSFAGTGRYSGHWLGDNTAKFDDLFYSISGCLNMGIFGISVCGADVCGFGGDTTSELCARWYELGAFYPFFRNHNTNGAKSQEPYVLGPDVLKTSKKMIFLRYQLLPYLYTLLYKSHVFGDTVFRPIFFNFPSDSSGYLPFLDRQFFWGDGLMVSPVTESGKDSISIYFANSEWYDFYSGERLVPKYCEKVEAMCTLPAPLGSINIHILGGNIIPMKIENQEMTTYDLRVKQPYEITVALDQDDYSYGELFLDDGDSVGSIEENKYSLISFEASKSQNGGEVLVSKIIKNGYSAKEGLDNLNLETVRMLGVNFTVNEVKFQGKKYVDYSYDSNTQILLIQKISTSVLEKMEFQIN